MIASERSYSNYSDYRAKYRPHIFVIAHEALHAKVHDTIAPYDECDYYRGACTALEVAGNRLYFMSHYNQSAELYFAVYGTRKGRHKDNFWYGTRVAENELARGLSLLFCKEIAKDINKGLYSSSDFYDGLD